MIVEVVRRVTKRVQERRQRTDANLFIHAIKHVTKDVGNVRTSTTSYNVFCATDSIHNDNDVSDDVSSRLVRPFPRILKENIQKDVRI